MNSKTRIRVSGINDLTNARFFASQMPDWIGIDLNPIGSRPLSLADAKELIGWLAGASVTGEFENRDADEILFLANELGLESICVPYGLHLPHNELTVFEKVELRQEAIPETLLAGTSDYLIVEMPEVFSQEDITPQMDEFLQTALSSGPVFLGAPLYSDELAPFIQKYRPYGFSIQAGSEMGSGMGDFSDYVEMLEELRKV